MLCTMYKGHPSEQGVPRLFFFFFLAVVSTRGRVDTESRNRVAAGHDWEASLNPRMVSDGDHGGTTGGGPQSEICAGHFKVAAVADSKGVMTADKALE